MKNYSRPISANQLRATTALCVCALTAVLIAAAGPEAAGARRGGHGHQHSAAPATKSEANSDDQSAASEESNQEATTESNLEAGSANSEASQDAGSGANNQSGQRSNSDQASSDADKAGNSTAASGTEEPHTLLFYVISAISTIISVTVVLAIISSFSVTMCAIVWQVIKMSNAVKNHQLARSHHFFSILEVA